MKLLSNLKTSTATTLARHNEASGEGSQFERDFPWLKIVFAVVMAKLSIASGYASFVGIQLFINEVGGDSVITNGTSVMMTLSIVTILSVGWSSILGYGPEAPTKWLQSRMAMLGLSLMALTLLASTSSNIAAIVGPVSKLHAWSVTHFDHVDLTNALELYVLRIDKILSSWKAMGADACGFAELELGGGVASGSGAGSGSVAASLSRVCEQSKSFVASMETARDGARAGVLSANGALSDMQAFIRDRDSVIIDREDRFLEAGVALNRRLQQIRASDLRDVLDVGASQVRTSVAELGENSGFSARQAEAVAGIIPGLEGLVTSTEQITERLQADGIPAQRSIESLDLISAIEAHALRYFPMASIAVSIDLFRLWALFFLMTGKAGARQIRQSARHTPEAESRMSFGEGSSPSPKETHS